MFSLFVNAHFAAQHVNKVEFIGYVNRPSVYLDDIAGPAALLQVEGLFQDGLEWKAIDNKNDCDNRTPPYMATPQRPYEVRTIQVLVPVAAAGTRMYLCTRMTGSDMEWQHAGHGFSLPQLKDDLILNEGKQILIPGSLPVVSRKYFNFCHMF